VGIWVGQKNSRVFGKGGNSKRKESELGKEHGVLRKDWKREKKVIWQGYVGRK